MEGILNSPTTTPTLSALGTAPPDVDMGGATQSLRSRLGGLTMDGGSSGDGSQALCPDYQQQQQQQYPDGNQQVLRL